MNAKAADNEIYWGSAHRLWLSKSIVMLSFLAVLKFDLHGSSLRHVNCDGKIMKMDGEYKNSKLLVTYDIHLPH